MMSWSLCDVTVTIVSKSSQLKRSGFRVQSEVTQALRHRAALCNYSRCLDRVGGCQKGKQEKSH